MSDKKQQLWLRPDQVDLMLVCINHMSTDIDAALNSSINDKSLKNAGRYTKRRMAELTAMIEAGRKP